MYEKIKFFNLVCVYFCAFDSMLLKFKLGSALYTYEKIHKIETSGRDFFYIHNVLTNVCMCLLLHIVSINIFCNMYSIKFPFFACAEC